MDMLNKNNKKVKTEKTYKDNNDRKSSRFGYIMNAKGRIVSLVVMLLILALPVMLAACSSGSSSGSGTGGTDSSAALTKIEDFTTVDLDGNEVTQDVFSNAEITMINFWGTYCAPCRQEMPELQKISDKYEGKAQVLGVVVDVDFEDPDSAAYKNAISILDWAEAEFRNIRPEGGIKDYLQTMQYIPTTIFVDSEGNIIGDPVIGPDTEEYKKRIEEQLAE